MRILLYPTIRTQDELDDLYHRLCWYLPDMAGHTVVFPFLHGVLTPGAPPEGFGTLCDPEFTPEYVHTPDNPDQMRQLNRADALLLWNDRLNPMERYNLSGTSRYPYNICKDSLESRHEAYHLAILRHEYLPASERAGLARANLDRFAAVADSLRREHSYVFGTGPSLARAMERDFSDGLRIVCNTTVCNEELMDHLRPQVIVAADPALHFGVSRYAARFREHLVRAMERHGSYLFMPLGYWPLFVRRYPELADRTFGVPVVPAKPENVSLNLVERYQIACYANILTLLLLPLGFTLSREVGVLGCDGRAPEGVPSGNASPFWRHHEASELSALYDTLKTCHPSFFALDFEDWYAGHCQGVKVLVDQATEAGITVTSLTPSYIPCLTERMEGPERSEIETAVRQAPVPRPEFEDRVDTRTKGVYRVAVIVSLYKAERFLAPMMENLLGQTAYRRGEVEILLIDSASPQNERRILAPYLERCEHLFYGRTPERETLYGSFNRAIRHSRAPYVMNLDVDNRLRPDAIDIFAEALDLRPDVGLVYGNQFVGQFQNEGFHNHVRFGRLHRPRFSRDMMLHKFYFGSEMMWRKSLHDEIGYYDDSFVVAADYEMVCRYATVTDFLHVDRFFGLYLKNLQGVEYTNLPLCQSEDERIREQYRQSFPAPVDPPRVHVHYPIDPKNPDDYLTVVCQTMSFDKPITRNIMKLLENLEFPHIIYCLDQNSSQATRESIAHLVGEGLVVPGEELLPQARRLFESRIAYRPTICFWLLAHGETVLLDQDFLRMNRPRLTAYFREAHKELTARFRTPSGAFDPLKTPMFCDHHEFERLDLTPHLAVDADGLADDEPADMAVFIQHFAPEPQTEKYREALKRCIASVRAQDFGGRVRVVVTDDGSAWSRELAGSDPARLIKAHDRASLARFECARDIDADLYLYKPRTGYFSKGLLWNAALGRTREPLLLFMDDDQHFLRPDSLSRYARHLRDYELVIGHTRSYRFRDIDGVVHNMGLGYSSPVVQGSNFGLRRPLLEAAGGFDTRTFLWGTGDDPALFWKLYLLLRPLDGGPMRACYAEDIVTENPYSGRWRADCRVDLELFIRDFLRLHGVHPNSNPSRDRSAWVRLLPAEQPDDTAPAALAAAQPQGLTMIVPAAGASAEDLWLTTASLLEQRLPEPLRVILAAGPGGLPPETLLPARVEVLRTASDEPGPAVLEALAAADTPFAGWVAPGALLAEKALKGSLTALRDGGRDAVLGASLVFDPAGGRLEYRQPPFPSGGGLLPWAGLWLGGQPVIGRADLLKKLPAEAALGPAWDASLLLALRDHAAGGSREQIHSLHLPGAVRPVEPGLLAPLLAGEPETLATALTGLSRHLNQSRETGEAEHLRQLPWARAHLHRLQSLRRAFDALARRGVRRVALYGAGAHSRNVLTWLWPAGIEAVCLLDDAVKTGEVAGLPVFPADAKETPEHDAVLVSTPRHEAAILKKCRERGLEAVPLYTAAS